MEDQLIEFLNEVNREEGIEWVPKTEQLDGYDEGTAIVNDTLMHLFELYKFAEGHEGMVVLDSKIGWERALECKEEVDLILDKLSVGVQLCQEHGYIEITIQSSRWYFSLKEKCRLVTFQGRWEF